MYRAIARDRIARVCNLYNIKVSRADFNAYFQSSDDWRREMTVEKDYVSPSKPGYVVREVYGARQLGVMNWGFPPPPGVKPLVVNVRNYTSPFWRTALSKPDRRCLVPVTEFQEWSVKPDPLTGKKTRRRSLSSYGGESYTTQSLTFSQPACDAESCRSLTNFLHFRQIESLYMRNAS